jgi:hypothetical protein
MSVVSLFIESCNRNENQDEELNNEEKVQYAPNRQNVQQVLAIAVDKSFENSLKQQSLTKGSVSDITPYKLVAETNTPILHVSYPYDYIKIYNVFKFSCAGVESPVVQAICGDGEIDIFIADFGLFDKTEETDMNLNSPEIGEPILADIMMGELMIVFKNDLGIYSCISNSAGVIDLTAPSGYYNEFSSHKYLSDKALEKNIIYPIYQFIVKLIDGKVTLKTTGIDYNTVIYADDIPLYNQQAVSAQELFNLIELNNNIPEISLQCEVIGLFENYFTVKTDNDSNIEVVYYDEYTGFFIEDKDATSADIHVGDVITVMYSKLYESYNPKSVIANKIFD